MRSVLDDRGCCSRCRYVKNKRPGCELNIHVPFHTSSLDGDLNIIDAEQVDSLSARFNIQTTADLRGWVALGDPVYCTGKLSCLQNPTILQTGHEMPLVLFAQLGSSNAGRRSKSAG